VKALASAAIAGINRGAWAFTDDGRPGGLGNRRQDVLRRGFFSNEGRLMKRTLFYAAVSGFMTAFATSAFATNATDVDAVKINERVFNDFSTTSLATTNNYPTAVIFDESGYVDDGMGGNFANRHDAILSVDGGASEAVFNIDDPISFSADVTLIPTSDAPRKEAGLRLNSPVSGDVLFLVNSDAGEIVAFGGGAPFYLFGSGLDGYFSGDTLRMGIDYIPSGGGSNGVPGRIQYWIDRDADGVDIETSGYLNWANLEGGPVSYRAGFYLQASPNLGSTDSAYASFENIEVSAIPEPASAAVAGVVLLASLLLTRRRS
jgi:hypothetical protein